MLSWWPAQGGHPWGRGTPHCPLLTSPEMMPAKHLFSSVLLGAENDDAAFGKEETGREACS